MTNKIVNPEQSFSYVASEVPDSYKCQVCGVTHVKLWRKYQTFLDHNTLVCASCLSRMYRKDGFTPVFQETTKGGRWLDQFGQFSSDSIGEYVPAVPTEENDAFWGYTSVPTAGCQWWKGLPNGI